MSVKWCVLVCAINTDFVCIVVYIDMCMRYTFFNEVFFFYLTFKRENYINVYQEAKLSLLPLF